MYISGMGLREIQRVTDIHHTTIRHWLREAKLELLDEIDAEASPKITEIFVKPKHLSR